MLIMANHYIHDISNFSNKSRLDSLSLANVLGLIKKLRLSMTKQKLQQTTTQKTTSQGSESAESHYLIGVSYPSTNYNYRWVSTE